MQSQHFLINLFHGFIDEVELFLGTGSAEHVSKYGSLSCFGLQHIFSY